MSYQTSKMAQEPNNNNIDTRIENVRDKLAAINDDPYEELTLVQKEQYFVDLINEIENIAVVNLIATQKENLEQEGLILINVIPTEFEGHVNAIRNLERCYGVYLNNL